MNTQNSSKAKEVALLGSTFLIAICGLIYELLEGTLSSYLLGDSVYHFSLIIGLFVSSMGIGAWISRFIDEKLEKSFVLLQLLIALIGGFSAFILFYAFAYIDNYNPILYLLTILIGSMLGVEIPLIIRILEQSFSLQTNISNVFTLDYIGALVASLLFPLVLVPKLGLMQTSFLFGMINLAVGVMSWYIFRDILSKVYLFIAFLIGSALLVGFVQSNSLTSFMEKKLYNNPIIYSKQTPYQKILITAKKQRVQFYINGAIQFDSIDEYRYHESLVHPAMISTKVHENVLIIGGGDGMALREVLKYNEVQKVTLIDLDKEITELFKHHQILSQLNHHAYDSPKVHVQNMDAWKFLESSQELYDVIIIDLPDPNNLSLSRLYSETFYALVSEHLSKMGVMVTQASSPLYSRKAFWSIEKTLFQSGFKTLPYHTYVPSFGIWGFVMGAKNTPSFDVSKLPNSLKYLNAQTLQKSTFFDTDMQKIEVQSNTLSRHSLVQYYEEGWKKWYE